MALYRQQRAKQSLVYNIIAIVVSFMILMGVGLAYGKRKNAIPQEKPDAE